MASKTERMSVRLEARESAMLRQLASSMGESKSDVLRILIQEAYQQKLPNLSTRAGFGFALGGLLPAVQAKPAATAKPQPKAKPKAAATPASKAKSASKAKPAAKAKPQPKARAPKAKPRPKAVARAKHS